MKKMIQEEKQLLIKDLCARLPYGVKVYISSESDGRLQINTVTLDIDFLHKYMLDGGYYSHGLFYKTPGFQLLPYLRPMSSMTEEELKWYYNKLATIEESRIRRQKHIEELNDWLLSHHFDYRGLIEKELALVAPEGMYKK